MPEESKVVKVNYTAGNSHRKRDEEAASTENKEEGAVENPRVQKLEGVTATVQKKSLGQKIAETFNGDDTKKVGEYLLFEVALPSAKDLVFDIFTQGLERKLFGASSPRNARTRGGAGPINYNTISKVTSGIVNKGETIRDNARGSEQAQSYQNLTFPNRGMAEEVLNELNNVIENYGVVRVADLHSMVGITGPFTDVKFGWDDLRGVSPKYHRGTYYLDLPRPVQIS